MNAINGPKVYDLEQPRYFGAPIFPSHAPGMVYSLHRRHEAGTGEARTSASGIIYMTEHSGTHIDALCHQAEGMYLYGGQAITPQVQTSTGFRTLGAETIPPLLARGVLLDIARLREQPCIEAGHPISRAELQAAAQSLHVIIQAGDIVLVRTGNGAIWHDAESYLRAGGVQADASAWLAEQHVLAVGADNVAWDEVGLVDPNLHASLPGHLILLVRHGIYILENLYLEELAHDQCTLFTCIVLPLKIQGATGSPVRPIALAPVQEALPKPFLSS